MFERTPRGEISTRQSSTKVLIPATCTDSRTAHQQAYRPNRPTQAGKLKESRGPFRVTEAALLVSDYRLIVIIDGNLDYSAINQYKCSLAGYYSAVRPL
jgi:hypothetical protein